MESSNQISGVLTYHGPENFRQKIVFSTLSGKTIKIKDIRTNDENPGIRDYEASFLRLIDKMSNGCKISINETGTTVYYKPGVLIGGNISHDCSLSRSIGYFLEGILPLAPFGKDGLNITFGGVTNNELDPSVDLLRTATLINLKNFGLEEMEIKIKKRGAPPLGGGQIFFFCPILRELTPVKMIEEGKIRRIRGIAYSTKVSPSFSQRMIEGAKSVLTEFMEDIFLYADHYTGPDSGNSPGFGIELVAETTNGCVLAAEKTGAAGILPEELAKEVAFKLLNEINNGGCTDTINQALIFTFMAICPARICRFKFGKLSEFSIQTLRLLRDFFGVYFKLETNGEEQTITAICRGIGFVNTNRRAI